MMKHFFYFCLLSLFYFLFFSCSSIEQKKDINSEDTLEGRKVVSIYEDSLPAVVQFYKVDSGGNMTQELYREIRYYQGKKKYTDCSFTTIKEDSAWIALKEGPAFAYHENGKIQTEAFYVKGKEHGTYKVYREDGKLFYEGVYSMGERDGAWKFYYKNGKLGKEGTYKGGICVREWIDYDLNGKVVQTIEATDTTIVCGDCPKCKYLLLKRK